MPPTDRFRLAHTPLALCSRSHAFAGFFVRRSHMTALRAGALLACLAFSSFVAAQSAPPSVEVPNQLNALREEQAELRKEIREQGELLKQIMHNIGVLNAQAVGNQPPIPPDIAGRKAAEIVERIEDFAATGTRFAGDLRDDINKCIGSAKEAANAIAADSKTPWAELAGCGADERRRIVKRIEALQQEAQRTYENCRDTLSRDSRVLADRLPYDGARVDTDDLKVLDEAQLATEDARACVSTIKETVKDLQDADKAKAAMSQMLALAANVCFASGGNPYVCGAMIALAVLMDIFDGSGDGGGEDGKGGGDGPGDDAGIPSMSTTPGPGGEGEGDDPTAGKSGPPAELGTLKDGKVQCGVERNATKCWLTGQPGTARLFSPSTRPQSASRSGRCEQRLRDIIGRAEPTPDLFGCTAGDDPDKPTRIVGISYKVGDAFCEVGLQDEGSATYTKFTDPEVLPANSTSACGDAK